MLGLRAPSLFRLAAAHVGDRRPRLPEARPIDRCLDSLGAVSALVITERLAVQAKSFSSRSSA